MSKKKLKILSSKFIQEVKKIIKIIFFISIFHYQYIHENRKYCHEHSK